ncbi:MAG: AI-2E family transporter, partial [Candidatus Binatia bacterium]
MESDDAVRGGARLRHDDFLRRTLVVIGLTALVGLVGFILWSAVQVLLLVFAGILLAVFLRGVSDWVSAHTPLSSGWALAGVLTGLLLLFGLGFWLLAPRVIEQADQLVQSLPRGVERVEQWLEQYTWG